MADSTEHDVKPPARESSWLRWLYDVIFTQVQEVQSEEENSVPRDPLQVSEIFANWTVVQSPEDMLNSLKTKIEKQERAREIQQFKKRHRPSRALDYFVTAVATFAKDESDMLKQQIDPNSRASIMSRIVTSFQNNWLTGLESLYSKDTERTPDSLVSWQIFQENFTETKYSKNILGSMKDIGNFIYHGSTMTGLTPKLVMDIAIRWTEILWRAMTELMERELSAMETDAIEKMVCDSLVGTLVRMHIDVAKKSHDALEREGRLPQQWEEEDSKMKAQLEEIKRLGTADARYSVPAPAIAPETFPSAKDREETADMLERMLQSRTQ